MFYLLVLLLGPSVELLGSGDAEGVVTRPWVRCDSGPLRIRSSSLGPPSPSLRLSVARSCRVLPIGAAFGTLHGVSRM